MKSKVRGQIFQIDKFASIVSMSLERFSYGNVLMVLMVMGSAKINNVCNLLPQLSGIIYVRPTYEYTV